MSHTAASYSNGDAGGDPFIASRHPLFNISSIPEIFNSILLSGELSPADLSRCIGVCRTWRTSVENIQLRYAVIPGPDRLLGFLYHLEAARQRRTTAPLEGVRKIRFWSSPDEITFFPPGMVGNLYPWAWQQGNGEQTRGRTLMLAVLHSQSSLTSVALPALPQSCGWLILRAIARLPLVELSLKNLAPQQQIDEAYELDYKEILSMAMEIPTLRDLRLYHIRNVKQLDDASLSVQSLTSLFISGALSSGRPFGCLSHVRECRLAVLRLFHIGGSARLAPDELELFQDSLQRLYLGRTPPMSAPGIDISDALLPVPLPQYIAALPKLRELGLGRGLVAA